MLDDDSSGNDSTAPVTTTPVTAIRRGPVATIDIPDGEDHDEGADIPDSTSTEPRTRQHTVTEEVEVNAMTHTIDTTLLQPSKRPPILTHDQCVCKQYHFNKSCSLKLCKGCCTAAVAYCVVTDHARAKVGGRASHPEALKKSLLSGLVGKINSLMKDGKDVFMSYGGGRNPGDSMRKITPLHWEKPGIVIRALCHNETPPIEKSFNLLKITRLEVEPWAAPIGSARSSQQKDERSELAPFDVSNWLKGFHMEKYLPAFIDNRFTLPEAISVLNKDMLVTMGVTMLGHHFTEENHTTLT